MRILLVGEYSRLHNSLKEGLQQLGHEVIILAAGDGFKKYPVDIHVDHIFRTFLLKKLMVLVFKLTKIDLGSLQIYRRFFKQKDRLKNFDVVQLINESALKMQPKHEKKALEFLAQNNKSLFLLTCGIDYTCMKYMMEDIPKYSLMSPYLVNKSLKKIYQFQLKYLTTPYVRLHQFLLENINGIISTDMDYHLPMIHYKTSKYLGLIANPVNVEKIAFTPLQVAYPIRIFHGVNVKAKHKKGNHYFSEALQLLKQRYPEKITIIETYSLPYKEYIKSYESCHILLDQVYGYDQGYNALEAMAKGKVVFTGAEQEWLDYYNLEEDTVAINALPDVDAIYKKLEWLILNPEKIKEISRNARAFIEKEHDYTDIARKYLTTWKEHS